VIALIRYLLADLLRTQRLIAPLLLYLAVLAVLYSGDAGGPLPAYAATAGALYPVAAWLAVVVAGGEEPAQRAVTTVAAGGWARMLGGVLGAALVLDAGLVVLGTLVPVVVNPHPYPPVDVLAGAVGHVVCGVTGTAVGLLFGRPLVRRVGVSVLGVVAAVAVTFGLRHHSPVGAVLTGLGSDQPPDLTPVLGLAAGSAALVLAAATTLVYLLGRSRL
jgi:hypothetical protein